MARDVAGISRVNMFEKVVDPTTGATFTPVSRTGRKVVYKADDGSRFEAPDYRLRGEDLAYYRMPPNPEAAPFSRSRR